MLNIEALYDKVKLLIIWAARKNMADGHAILNLEDMIAEGNLIFSKIASEYKDVEESRFLKIFKASLYNHYKDLIFTHRFAKKSGYIGQHITEEGEVVNDRNWEEYTIDLSDIAEEIGEDRMHEIFYDNYVAHVKSMLADNVDATILFNELINPSREACQIAINESKRKACLFKQGKLIRGANVVRVKTTHIKKYLGWPDHRFSAAMSDVKIAALVTVSV